MKIGVSTGSFYLRRETEDAVSLLARRGIPVAEVFLNSYGEYGPSFAETLAARKGETELFSVHVLTTQFEPQLFAEHPRVKEDARGWLDRTLASARIFGARAYSFHGITRFKRTFHENLPRLAASLAETAEFCRARGVRLCLENVEWALCNRPGVFGAMRAAYPALGGVLDLKQARISGHDYREYLREMGPSLSHVHVSDFDGTRNRLPGEGNFDFGELFSRLADVGFDGPVFIEMYAREYGTEEALFHAYEFLAEKAEKYAGNSQKPLKKN